MSDADVTAPAPSTAPSPAREGWFARAIEYSGGVIQVPLVIACGAVSMLLFGWLGGVLGFPSGGPFDAAILHQPMWVAKLVAIVAVLWLLVALFTLVLGRIRYDAGWGVAVAGLLGLRLRGGDGYYALHGRDIAVFWGFATELAILALVIAVPWTLLHFLRERGQQSPGLKRVLELPDPKARLVDRKVAGDNLGQRVLSLAVATAGTVVIVLAFAKTTEMPQTIFAVGVGAWIGSILAHAVAPARPGPWFWGAPILAAFVGYIAAATTGDATSLATGEVGGSMPALGRPLPLDWIAAGVPMALVGYVRSRTKQLHQVAEAQAK